MNDEIRELENRLAQAENSRVRVDTLNELAWQIGDADPQRALRLAQEAYDLATADADRPYRLGAGRSLLNLGRFNYHFSRHDKAHCYLTQALPLLEEEEGQQDLVAKVWMGLGLIRWQLADYPAALTHLLQALDLCRAIPDKDGEAYVLSNLGMVYSMIEEQEKALDVYEQALTIHREASRPSNEGFTLNNMGMVYGEAGRAEEALACAQQSLRIAAETGNPTLESHALDTAGMAYVGLGDLEQALSYFRKSADLAESVGSTFSRIAALRNMGMVYAQQDEPGRALAVLEEALALAREIDSRHQIRQCHEELAQLHKQAGNFAQALSHYEAFHAADKAIFNETADMRLKTLQVVHDTETTRQEAEIAHLRNVELEQEIAERERAERALRESEERLRSLINSTPDVITFKDGQGRWVVANDAVLRLFQLEGVDYCGKAAEELAAHSPFYRQALLVCDESDEIAWQNRVLTRSEEIVPRPGGGEVVLDVIKVPLFHEDGSRKGIVVLGRDITELRQAETLLRRAQKMESLGVLAGGVAHDFNNLLVAILGQTSLALAKMRRESSARSHVEKAVGAAEKAADLTQQMLAYSGRGHFEVRLTSLNTLIEENAHLFEASLPKNVRLQTNLAPALPLIEADASQMQQVVMNLIINGAEAIGSRPGQLTVATGTDVVDDPDTVYGQHTGEPLSPGRYVFLDVQDNGGGMDEETLNCIFDPFFTTKERGHGLGLSAVLGIVRGHNGGLRVTSRPGRGTTFRLLLPAQAEADDTPDPSPDEATDGVVSARVLVIDDEEPVREAVADILRLKGIDVLAAPDGVSGVALYERERDGVDLVLLDLSMPGLSGEDTYRRLCEVDSGVRVVLTSGYDRSEVMANFDNGLPAGFIQKPYSAETLVEQIGHYLEIV